MRAGYFLDPQFLHATAVLAGTMVGVGIFGLPFAFAKAGFGMGLIFFALTISATIAMNLMFSEVILRTRGKHQLVGYTREYLGLIPQRIVLLANILGISGALLAYIIAAGEFLSGISASFVAIDPSWFSFAFFLLVSCILPFGFRTIATIEFGLAIIFSVIILSITGVSIPHISVEHFQGFNSDFWFLPYGILLFAFAGLTSLPIQREVLRGKERLLRPSIITAVSIVGTLFLLFTIAVVGVMGPNTEPQALTNLADTLGGVGHLIVTLGSLFGVVAITTSYLMLGTALTDIFRLDYGIPRRWALLLAGVPPILLYILGLRSFITVISLIGTLAIGIESVVLIVLYRRSQKEGTRDPEYQVHIPFALQIALAMVFVGGVIYELLFA